MATLDIALRGDTSALDRSLARSEKGVQRFSLGISQSAGAGQGALVELGGKGGAALGGTQKALDALASRGGAIAGLMAGAMSAVAGAIAGAVHSIVDSVGRAYGEILELGKAAARLGVAPESLATLELAAARVGLSAEEMNHGFRHFQRTLSQAAQGSVEASMHFNQLGLDIGELTKLRPEIAFLEALRAVDALASNMDKIRLEMALLGRGGAGLRAVAAQFDPLRQQTDAVAAGLEGMPEGVNNTAEALKRFNDQLGGAAAGGAARLSFDALGLSARALLDLPLKGRLQQIEEALSRVVDPALRARLALDTVGRADILPTALLANWEQQFDALRQRAQQIGLAISGGQMADIQAAAGAWAELKAAITGVGRSIVVALGPFMKQAAQTVLDWGVSLATTIRDSMPLIRQLADVVARFAAGLTALPRAQFGALIGDLAGAAGLSGEGLLARLPDVLEVLGALADTIGDVGRAFGELTSTVVRSVIDVVRSLGGWAAAQVGLDSAVADSLGTWEGFRDGVLKVLFTVQYGLQNWREAAALALDKVALAFVSLGNDLEHFFTQTIPAAIGYAVDAFRAFGAAVVDIFGGIGEGLRKGLEGDWDGAAAAVRGAMDGAAAGFDGAMKRAGEDWDERAGREETDLEKRLRERIGAREEELREGLDEFVKKKMDEIAKGRRGGAWWDVEGDEAGKGGGQGIQKAFSKVGAMEFGSKEAFSALTGGADTQKAMFGVAQKQLDEQKGMRLALEKLLNKRFGANINLAAANLRG